MPLSHRVETERGLNPTQVLDIEWALDGIVAHLETSSLERELAPSFHQPFTPAELWAELGDFYTLPADWAECVVPIRYIHPNLPSQEAM